MTDQMTITEALAEVRLIEKKLEKKRNLIGGNTSRLSHVADLYASDGGSPAVMSRELQAIRDLNERQVKIRIAIAVANLATVLNIGGKEHSITGWLAWRRDVADNQERFLVGLSQRLQQDQKEIESNPPAYKDEEGKVKLSEIVYNVDQADVDKQAAEIVEVMGVLDGKLSLLNATTVVKIG